MRSIFTTAISEQLKGRSLAVCSIWAERCRMIKGKPMSFNQHPWSKDILDCDERECCCQKAAQVGITETMLNRAFYLMDQRKWDIAYYLPNKIPDATDFSNARFDPAIEESQYLSSMFTSTKNVGHKRAGTANLYIRGSNSKVGLRSIPVAGLFIDEVDVCADYVLPMARERLSGQQQSQLWTFSTPTIEGHGINAIFSQSDQRHFFFKCPSCSRFIELTFPKCLKFCSDSESDAAINDSYLICPECEAKLPHEQKPQFLKTGIWVPAQPGKNVVGFYINQMYSSTVTPGDLAKSFLKGQRDLAEEQEFYNSKLGIVHTPEGNTVTDAEIVSAIGDYVNGDSEHLKHLPVTIGIDVGKFLHVVVVRWDINAHATLDDINSQAVAHVIHAFKIESLKAGFPELDPIIRIYQPRAVIIDAQPERRSASDFATRWNGLVRTCFYGDHARGRNLVLADNNVLTVDRTIWLDTSLGRFHSHTIKLPANIDHEFKTQIRALTRITRKNSQGNPVSLYLKPAVDDHYAHALNYAEIALKFLSTSSLSTYNWG